MISFLSSIQALGVDTEEDVHKLTTYFIMHQQATEVTAAETAANEEMLDAPFTVDTDKQVWCCSLLKVLLLSWRWWVVIMYLLRMSLSC